MNENNNDDARPKPARDGETTRTRILSAARSEFSRLGLGGARVDRIAALADTNKRMVYRHFSSKEMLFTSVLEAAYLDMRKAEQALDLDGLPARVALETLVRFTWQYYLDHPEFITLVNSENMYHGRHLQKVSTVREAGENFMDMLARLLDRGVAEGVFRPGIDPVQLNITIASVGYYYFTNRYTGTILFGRDMMSAEALEARLRFNVETILRLVAP